MKKINDTSREKIKNIVFSDVIQMFSSLTINSVQITSNIIVLLVAFAVAFSIHKSLSFLLFIFTLLGFSVSFFSRKVIKKQSKNVNAQLKEQNAFINGFVDKIEIFKTHDLTNYYTNKHNTLMKNFQTSILKSDGVQVFLKTFLQGLRSFFSLVVVCLILVLNSEASIGDVLFLSLISELILSMSSDTELFISQCYSLLPAFENMEMILKMPEQSFGKKTYSEIKTISCEDVSFKFSDKDGNENFVLNSFGFHFRAGDRVRIMGKNGSGKSTIAKLLSGLISPTSGEIKINGSAIQSYSRSFLKQKYFMGTSKNFSF